MKKIKRIIILLLIINIIMQIISITNVRAVESDTAEVTINVSNKNVQRGDTITITISVKGTTKGVTGLQGTLKYDKNVLEYVSKNILLDGWRCTGYNNDTGIFLAEISSTSDTTSYITSNTPLISFTYKVKDNAKEGITEFKAVNLITVNSSLSSTSVSENITVLSNNTNSIKYVNPNTTLKDLLNTIDSTKTVELYNSNNQKIEDNTTKLATGMKFRIIEGTTPTTYEIVVRGDLTGNGQASQVDLLKLARYNANLENLEGLYLKAADVNGDGQEGNDLDILKLARLLTNIEKM